jgi:hypothetical protein
MQAKERGPHAEVRRITVVRRNAEGQYIGKYVLVPHPDGVMHLESAEEVIPRDEHGDH